MKKFCNIFVILFAAIILIGLKQAATPFTYEKLTKASEIPSFIQDLSNTELSRGVYYFATSYTNDDAFLVLCGGENYSNGYNVEITSQDYVPVIVDSSQPRTAYGTLPSFLGLYELDIKEKHTETLFEYCKNAKYPFVVFKIKGDVEYYWVKVNSENDLNVNYWWGEEQLELSSSNWECKVVQTEDEIPDYINKPHDIKWNIINDERSPEYGDTTCIVVTGKQEESPFGVSIEYIRWEPEINTFDNRRVRYFDIVLRKHFNQEPALEYNGIPYSLIEMQTSQDYDSIGVRNIIILDDHLGLKQNINR